MTSDGYALRLGEMEAALVKDVKGTASVAAAVTPPCLPKVVEKSCHGYTIRRNTTRVSAYVLIYFKGVTCEAAVLLMVAVAATPEVIGRLKV